MVKCQSEKVTKRGQRKTQNRGLDFDVLETPAQAFNRKLRKEDL